MNLIDFLILGKEPVITLIHSIQKTSIELLAHS